MAGTGPAPREGRIRSGEPTRGEWRAAPGLGWQHGDIPPCPARGVAAAETWDAWMRSWFAAHWTPQDMPVLRLVIKLWAKADTGKASGSERSELRQLMDSMGITPKGQQDRRWKPPEQAEQSASEGESPYAHLRVVGS